jgi:two-component system, OmpR family, sensor histidine kinase KdpD
VALAGGLHPGLFAAVAGFLLLTCCFTPPLHRLAIAERESLLALVAYLVAATAVSTVVDLESRRIGRRRGLPRDAEVLFPLAGNVIRGEHALATLLERLRQTFALTSVTLLERAPEAPLEPGRQRGPRRWRIVACVGGPNLARAVRQPASSAT